MSDTGQPLYQRIKEDVLSQIGSRLLSPGDRLPTEQEFMEKYRVSRITVSKALNELKAEGIIERFPNRGSFVSRSGTFPAETALAETAPVSGGIALPSDADCPMAETACIFPRIADLFSLSMANGVVSALSENGYLCHIFQSYNPTTENYLLQRCLELKLAGIVLFPQDQPFFSDPLMLMQLQKYPLVLIDRYLPHLNTSYVIGDNKTAGTLCLRHLAELGHQRFCFVTSSGRDTFSVRRRIAGVLEEMSARGIPESALCVTDRLDKTRKISHHQEAFSRLVYRERISAFICAESSTCAYLYRLFESLEIRVPDTVSLMCFDQPLVDSQRPDFFTHICQSEYLMGREAGMILKNQIENRDTPVCQRIIAPRLEIRQSTGSVS